MAGDANLRPSLHLLGEAKEMRAPEATGGRRTSPSTAQGASRETSGAGWRRGEGRRGKGDADAGGDWGGAHQLEHGVGPTRDGH